MFSKVVGTDSIRKDLIAGMRIEDIINDWSPELEDFKAIREKYLLYK